MSFTAGVSIPTTNREKRCVVITSSSLLFRRSFASAAVRRPVWARFWGGGTVRRRAACPRHALPPRRFYVMRTPSTTPRVTFRAFASSPRRALRRRWRDERARAACSPWRSSFLEVGRMTGPRPNHRSRQLVTLRVTLKPYRKTLLRKVDLGLGGLLLVHFVVRVGLFLLFGHSLGPVALLLMGLLLGKNNRPSLLCPIVPTGLPLLCSSSALLCS